MNFPPLMPDDPVIVVDEGEPLPLYVTYLGSIKGKDEDYETALSLALKETRKAGGNCLHIEQHKQPDAYNTSHRISGHIYYVDELHPVAEETAHPEEAGSPLLVASDGRSYIQPAAPPQPAEAFKPAYTWKETRVAVDVGYSYRIADQADVQINGLSQSEIKQAGNRLRNGVTYGIAVSHFFNNSFYGLGVRLAGNHYSVSKFGIKDGTNIYYFAPEFTLRASPPSKKNILIAALSIGCVYFNENLKFQDESVRIRAAGVRSTAEIGYDIRLGGNVFLGLKAAVVAGVVPIPVRGKTEYESLNAIEIGGGIRF